MRDILFRGFNRNENGKEQIKLNGEVIRGEWVEGCYVYDNNLNHHIRAFDNCYYAVIPETVGEYTGLNDKNGKKIFEGDRVRHYNNDDWGEDVLYAYGIGEIFYNKNRVAFMMTDNNSIGESFRIIKDCVYEVIGNIFEVEN